MCMAPVPEEIFTEGMIRLMQLDNEWVPTERGSALYIRPFSFASEAKFGVKISEEFRFIIFYRSRACAVFQANKSKSRNRICAGGKRRHRCCKNAAAITAPRIYLQRLRVKKATTRCFGQTAGKTNSLKNRGP